LRPHFKSLGKGCTFVKPWYVEVFGSPIELGDYSHVIATADRRVRLSVWSDQKDGGHIRIRRCSLICPGVRISSASDISIGTSCMLASDVYISDSDWHDIYDRLALGKTSPIRIEDNVWIGDSAIICKGVTIGENSIIGAGSVVPKAIPPNVIAVGNPATVVKTLDPDEKLISRNQLFSDPDKLSEEMDQMDKGMLGENSLLHWLRYLFFPLKKD
jgi:acetyltransferase-like isoleucine patch superfamily enzyme